MLILLFFYLFKVFPRREDAIFEHSQTKPVVEASGSLGLYYDDGKCRMTNPNETLTENKRSDWCSNVAKDENDHPWISYFLPGKVMKISGYSVRSGCCYYVCCCDPATGRYIDGDCCCELYSYSLLGSNDNKTWKTLHKIEKEVVPFCETKTFELEQKETFRFLKFVMDEQRPGCVSCMQINQFEVYGETINSLDKFGYDSDEEDNEESISIIGKVRTS